MAATEHPPTDERVVELDLAQGVVIYDAGNHQAWLQTDEAVDLDAKA